MGRVLLFATFVLASGLAIAQTTPTNHVHPTTTSLIEGHKHPELVPDQLAFQLVLMTTGNPADQAQWGKQRQYDHIRMIRLASDDATKFSKIADNFRVQFDDIVKRHNDAADVAWQRKEAPSQDNTNAQLDALVVQSIARLKAELSPDGFAVLEKYVQGEKRGISFVPAAQ